MLTHKACGQEFPDRAALSKHLFSKECTGMDEKVVEATAGYVQVEGEVLPSDATITVSDPPGDTDEVAYFVDGRIVKGVPTELVGETQVLPAEASHETSAVVLPPPGEFGEDCVCRGYEGQGWNCPLHGAVVECPRCRCINTELEEVRDEVQVTYRCGLCSAHYFRDRATGEYRLP